MIILRSSVNDSGARVLDVHISSRTPGTNLTISESTKTSQQNCLRAVGQTLFSAIISSPYRYSVQLSNGTRLFAAMLTIARQLIKFEIWESIHHLI